MAGLDADFDIPPSVKSKRLERMVLKRLLGLIGDNIWFKPKRTKMTSPQIPDDVLNNIFSRLPAKTLLRFRCVSKHWNSLISDPYFIKSRSPAPMILLCSTHLQVLDDNNTCSKLPSPFEYPKGISYTIIVVGTFNGIVLLALFKDDSELLLYNPSTRASKKLPDPPNRCKNAYNVFGFGHGKTRPDDLKIFLGHKWCGRHGYHFHCDVFSLKTGSWTTSNDIFRHVALLDNVGVFLNGFLHWICFLPPKKIILVLDVEEMVVRRMNLPCQSDNPSCSLGTTHGRLCLVENRHNGFDVWEHNDSWSKTCSFTLGLEGDFTPLHHVVCILDDGRIIVASIIPHNQLIICDPYKGVSYNVLTCTDCRIRNGIRYIENLIPFSF